MKATELRIGNHYNYHIKDEMDWRKEWMELSTIDVDDLKWLMDNPDDDDFHPVTISEQELLKFGFQKGYTETLYWNGLFKIINQNDKYHFVILGKNIHIQYVHQLQNLFFSLTEQELIYIP